VQRPLDFRIVCKSTNCLRIYEILLCVGRWACFNVLAHSFHSFSCGVSACDKGIQRTNKKTPGAWHSLFN